LYHFSSRGYNSARRRKPRRAWANAPASDLLDPASGAPLHCPRHPTVYAKMLGRADQPPHKAQCWLVNTGWSGRRLRHRSTAWRSPINPRPLVRARARRHASARRRCARSAIFFGPSYVPESCAGGTRPNVLDGPQDLVGQGRPMTTWPARFAPSASKATSRNSKRMVGDLGENRPRSAPRYKLITHRGGADPARDWRYWAGLPAAAARVCAPSRRRRRHLRPSPPRGAGRAQS